MNEIRVYIVEDEPLISETIRVPTIGIGSGVGCNGQVLVVQDLLGMYDKLKPKFNDFNRLFVFIHLEPTYKNKVWVLIDAGDDEKEIIEGIPGQRGVTARFDKLVGTIGDRLVGIVIYPGLAQVIAARGKEPGTLRIAGSEELFLVFRVFGDRTIIVCEDFL